MLNQVQIKSVNYLILVVVKQLILLRSVRVTLMEKLDQASGMHSGSGGVLLIPRIHRHRHHRLSGIIIIIHPRVSIIARGRIIIPDSLLVDLWNKAIIID